MTVTGLPDWARFPVQSGNPVADTVGENGFVKRPYPLRDHRWDGSVTGLPDWVRLGGTSGNPGQLQGCQIGPDWAGKSGPIWQLWSVTGLPDWVGNMAQSGNPGQLQGCQIGPIYTLPPDIKFSSKEGWAFDFTAV